MIEKAEDVGDQGSDAVKASRADDVGGDFAKEAFHQIEPGGRGGNEMEVKTGMTLKLGGDFGVLGGRIVVANNVKPQLGGDFLVDLAQEGEPLLMAMARGGVGKHLAGKGSPGRYRSVPVVVMGPGANVSLAQRQSGLGGFESLSRALFIAAEHQGLLGRVEIEAHDVPEFFLKPKVFGELEIAHPVGLQLMGRPESLHARFAQAGFTGHSAHTPRPTVRSPGARQTQGPSDSPGRQPWLASPPRGVLETSKPLAAQRFRQPPMAKRLTD